jgi:hypothetical protein
VTRLIFLRRGLRLSQFIYGLAYAICLGAGLGVVGPYVWGVFHSMFGTACIAFAAFNF